MPWPGVAKGTSRLQVKLLPVYHTQWRLHTVLFIAGSQTGKLGKLISIVLGLTRPEIRIRDKTLINIKIPCYSFIHSYSVTCARGVGIYNSNKCKHISSDKTFQFTPDKCENLLITIYKSESSKAKAITVGVIYRHPNQNLDDFIAKTIEVLQKLITNKTPFYSLSDLNVNIDHAQKNPSNLKIS